ncbi:MAG: acylphosphatase [Candidatus Odinarchaeota archaeon]|nr:acylphosphatase [Candidatus Odinarchaeota archaeon]
MSKHTEDEKRLIRGEFIVEGHIEDKEYLNILTQTANRLDLRGYIKRLKANKYIIVIEGCKTNIEIFAKQVVKNTVPDSLKISGIKATDVIFKEYKGDLPPFKAL